MSKIQDKLYGNPPKVEKDEKGKHFVKKPKKEEKAVASLFTAGGTHAQKGEFAGSNDFEVVAWLAILSETAA